MTKPYTLTSPCADCPFRTDIPQFLGKDRAREIADSCHEESNFYCHKTVDYSDDDEGRVASKSRVCAGFLITMEKEDAANQPTRIAERLGLYNRSKMDLTAPTHDSIEEWVESHELD